MKVNRKIVLSTAAVLGAAALVAGGTIAFFTDTAREDNVFTIGNVKVEVTEQQRKADGSGLEDFEQNKVLAPLVGSEGSSGYDSFNMPLAKNYGDKIVTVTNTGNSDAYIRAYVAIPKILDDTDPNYNLLHFNFGLNSNNQKTSEAGSGDWLWKTGGSWNYSTQTISTAPLSTAAANTPNVDIEYAVYVADYHEAIGHNETTERLLNGVYLDSGVTDINDTATGTEICLGANCTNLGYDVNTYGFPVLVYTVAAQADGFNSAAEAMTAAGFTTTTNPWAL